MLNFRLFGVPIRVEWYFWLMACVLYGFGDVVAAELLIWVAAVFLSIVVHEMGHALASRRFGLSPFVVLYGMGGLTYSPGAERLGRGRRILITLAGPAAGLLLALGVFVVANAWVKPGAPPLLFVAVRTLLYINVVWTFLNLLPVPPLDGGQVHGARPGAAARDGHAHHRRQRGVGLLPLRALDSAIVCRLLLRALCLPEFEALRGAIRWR